MDSDRLDHVTVNWDEAYSCLVGHGLPVVRVTRSTPSERVTVIWRSEPTTAQQMQANRLIRGAVATHAW